MSDDNSLLRRWTDKILCGLAIVVISLLGLVYGTVRADLAEYGSSLSLHAERITKAETRVMDIDKKLDRIEDKIDKLLVGK